ncbi:hypothetical protein V6Z11_D04G159200 [Gossypium hirsutum]|uniref:Uncharacterized protein n=1 Tax=Gossypium hirsutum TaxID=3635 RepID=A0A1U8IMS4_GOSHI|nr:uncharacterized protein LOC107898459 [Gossypium hirsutum]
MNMLLPFLMGCHLSMNRSLRLSLPVRCLTMFTVLLLYFLTLKHDNMLQYLRLLVQLIWCHINLQILLLTACLHQCIGYRPPPPPQTNFYMFGTRSPIVPWMPSSMPIASPTSSSPQSGWFSPPAPITNWTNPFALTSPQHGNAPPSATPQSQAYLATPETMADNAWYLDSGATHHQKNSATSLGESMFYNGPVSGS